MADSTNNHYDRLKSKWSEHHNSLRTSLVQNHEDSLKKFSEKVDAKKLAAGGLASLALLFSPHSQALPAPHDMLLTAHKARAESQAGKSQRLVEKIKNHLPSEMRKLKSEEEKGLEEVISESFNLEVKAELEGKRLNRAYGMIGGEQHLYRYPGDTLEQHVLKPEDRDMYIPSGIAPGLGAWGYFAPSKSEFTEKDEMRERYYLAVQTFLAEEYNSRVREYRDFFKYRKMLVVNPDTGQAVVAVIGDAGPAQWTGKHLGGSPEVMQHVGLAHGPRKGDVLYFFIEDPEDKIPLGPIEVN